MRGKCFPFLILRKALFHEAPLLCLVKDIDFLAIKFFCVISNNSRFSIPVKNHCCCRKLSASNFK